MAIKIAETAFPVASLPLDLDCPAFGLGALLVIVLSVVADSPVVNRGNWAEASSFLDSASTKVRLPDQPGICTRKEIEKRPFSA